MSMFRSLFASVGCLLVLTGALQAQTTQPVYTQLPDTLAILTPSPGPAPRINGPKVFGVRPGHPIRFTIPTTGTRPVTFSADKLPAGVRLDKSTGRLSGSV